MDKGLRVDIWQNTYAPSGKILSQIPLNFFDCFDRKSLPLSHVIHANKIRTNIQLPTHKPLEWVIVDDVTLLPELQYASSRQLLSFWLEKALTPCAETLGYNYVPYSKLKAVCNDTTDELQAGFFAELFFYELTKDALASKVDYQILAAPWVFEPLGIDFIMVEKLAGRQKGTLLRPIDVSLASINSERAQAKIRYFKAHPESYHILLTQGKKNKYIPGEAENLPKELFFLDGVDLAISRLIEGCSLQDCCHDVDFERIIALNYESSRRFGYTFTPEIYKEIFLGRNFE